MMPILPKVVNPDRDNPPVGPMLWQGLRWSGETRAERR
jgi:hypothetical protein